jgi:hypothetical protein
MDKTYFLIIILLIIRAIGKKMMPLFFILKASNINVITLKPNEIRYFDGTYYDTYKQEIISKGVKRVFIIILNRIINIF